MLQAVSVSSFPTFVIWQCSNQPSSCMHVCSITVTVRSILQVGSKKMSDRVLKYRKRLSKPMRDDELKRKNRGSVRMKKRMLMILWSLRENRNARLILQRSQSNDGESERTRMQRKRESRRKESMQCEAWGSEESQMQLGVGIVDWMEWGLNCVCGFLLMWQAERFDVQLIILLLGNV